jgi:peroxiredoxin
MAAAPPICDFGRKAVDFSLPGVDGGVHSLADIGGVNGTLIMFICNHCPYVKAIADKIARDAAELQALGIGVAAICANDAASYPADSFANMKLFAEQSGFTFPYLQDESQAVARAYDAICTPDFFGFNTAGELQYRGRLDESKASAVPNARRELVEAMRQVAKTGQGPRDQIASMGCSIKWKRAA